MHINLIGEHRLVLEFKERVIKIPNPFNGWKKFLKGLLSNLNEFALWHHYKDKPLSACLCPVLWSSWGGWILIMRKARQMSYDEYMDCEGLSLHFEHFKGDDSYMNYGFIDNRPVKIDYGSLN